MFNHVVFKVCLRRETLLTHGAFIFVVSRVMLHVSAQVRYVCISLITK